MKKILVVLLSLIAVTLAKGQGKPYGGPVGNPVGVNQPPLSYVVVQEFFTAESLFRAQLIKTGDKTDSMYSWYVSQKVVLPTGKITWEPYFCCSLDKEVIEPVVITIEKEYFFYYQNEEKKWTHIKFLTIKEAEPAPSRLFIYRVCFIFSAKSSFSPSS